MRQGHAKGFGDDLGGVAAVPRNWQPPPGEAQARQPSSEASLRERRPREKRAPIV